MKENKFPKKLGSFFPKKQRKEFKLKTVPINFKIIPNYNELLERLIQRKLILHSHQTFQNEKTNIYNENYLESFYNNLYNKKRNSSFSKLNKEKNYSFEKTDLPILNKSIYNTEEKVKKKKTIFLKNEKLSKEHLNDLKRNKSLIFTKNSFDEENKNNKSEQKKNNNLNQRIKNKFKKFKIIHPPLRIFHS